MYSLQKPITVSVTVSGGTGQVLFGGDGWIEQICSKPAGAYAHDLLFYDSDGYGLYRTDTTLSGHTTLPCRFRYGANGLKTTLVINGTDGVYSVRLWPTGI